MINNNLSCDIIFLKKLSSAFQLEVFTILTIFDCYMKKTAKWTIYSFKI